jgi:hypothetical protein
VNPSPRIKPERVLVVGRSPNVLVATVDILRAKGYSADVTNQFDRVLDDYDVTDLLLRVIADVQHRDVSPKQPSPEAADHVAARQLNPHDRPLD